MSKSTPRKVCEGTKSQQFPKKSLSNSEIEKEINKAIAETANYETDHIIGYPGSTPLKVATKNFNKFTNLNPNNIGTHTRTNSESGFAGTQNLEKHALTLIGDLFHADKDNPFDGYISSGGTEGMIMGLWILRNLVKAEFGKFPVVLKTPITHYSANKALGILGLDDIHDLHLNNKYKIDITSLIRKIRLLASQGKKIFIVICTLGYTVTGSFDELDEINDVLVDLERNLNVKTYIHLDAAYGGFIYPFLGKKKFGFNLKKIHTISLDAHKTGLVPYSCGIFLCRKNLQKYIETRVDYIHSHYDDTLVGSRSGAIAASLWAAITSLGSQGYRNIYRKCISYKNYFLRQLKEKHIGYWAYSDNIMNIVAIRFTGLYKGLLPPEIEKKYGLNLTTINSGSHKNNVYKIVFMPHVKGRIIDAFVQDIKNSIDNG